MPSAIIDIGTNTVILLIAKPKGKNGLKIFHDEACITRLGQGLTENHFFLSVPMTRTKTALESFKKTCEKFKVKKIFVVGTAACRTAANAQVFVDEIKKSCGIKINIISGVEEAEYVFGAAWHDFGAKDKKIIVVDIGGGSTEVITGPSNTKKNNPETLMSISVGSVKMTEQYVRSDPITDDELLKLHVAIRNEIADELDGFYPKDFNPKTYTLVATAGTATTLAAISQKIKNYDPDKIHGCILKKIKLEAIITDLASKTVKERQLMAGLDALRADVILTGAILLNELLKYFGKTEAVISDRGLRYGVFFKKFL